MEVLWMVSKQFFLFNFSSNKSLGYRISKIWRIKHYQKSNLLLLEYYFTSRTIKTKGSILLAKREILLIY